MIELRFHEELYDGFAIDEAVKTYAAYATAELSRDGGAYVVKVTAKPEATSEGIDERVLSAELANYALGLTIEKARAAGGAA
ncbi:HxsD-like protein [Polyangium sp. 6x1]|uniref:HxsD-like protein n=1 Tax=Polyangium sp. 6x1 TaxID=3042689 RepID=UPI002482D3EF|nr:HxsD-like protein [Polyangium sp. 6x1]MDI1448934.1 HxsD-like protein [Polyangium sp. 6x1]